MSDAPTQILPGLRPSSSRSSTPPPRSHLRAGLAWFGLFAYGAIVLLATLSPTPLDKGYRGAIDKVLGVLHRNGLPEWFGYGEVEFLANVAMFVPLGFFIGLVLPRVAVWAGLFIVPALSGAIEWIQGQMLAERFATLQDVLANSVGGWIGLFAAMVIRAIVHARDEKVIARALWEARG